MMLDVFFQSEVRYAKEDIVPCNRSDAARGFHEHAHSNGKPD